MRMRIASFLALSLALGTVFCSTAPTPALGRCCILTASDGSIDCYCGTFAAEGGVVSTVVVSGSTCTVTVTSDGGGGEQLKGYPPAAVTDCMNPVGN
jgi:ribulose kinase